MKYLLKKTAYIVHCIVLLFMSPHVEAADKQQINSIPLPVAILTVVITLAVLGGLIYLVLVTI